jgi:16S rRNA processing protein RimM
MNKTAVTYITVGKIGSTHGVRGWLKIRSYTEPAANILKYKPWFLSADHPIEIEGSKIQGDNLLIKFIDINSPEEARQFVGKTIQVTRDKLPALKHNEFYWSDLEGLTVINQHGKILGKVAYLIATGSNDVLVVKGIKECAIPYRWGTVIKKVDLAQQEIQVDWEE